MKKTLLFAAIAMLGAAGASATCWRINPSPYAGAQFKTVDDAMNDINVLPGDTLLLDPGTYGDITLKRENITIIGSGYFLSQNKQWAESQETIVNYITLSKGCKVEGCTASIIYSHELTTVTRCKVNKVYGNDNWKTQARMHTEAKVKLTPENFQIDPLKKFWPAGSILF